MLNYKTVSVTATENRKQTSHFGSETYISANETAMLNSCTLQSLKMLLPTFNICNCIKCYYKYLVKK